MPSLANPYRGLPTTSFWKSAVAEKALSDFDPIATSSFRIMQSDRVATAGSCFAQHISKALIREGVRFVQAEAAEAADAHRLPTFSARYGNIYTCRQLLQLFRRAYGLFTPGISAWMREDGCFVDPFRPNEFPAGFATIAEVDSARELHLAAVREVLESCDVFVFTLGLTEVWVSDEDGSAVPLPPGVVAAPVDADETFSPVNLSVHELTEDLLTFIDDMRLVNPSVRFMITVSPVPIIATFEQRHVIVSNAYSKAVLRVVAQHATSERRDVFYFPSYEMIVTHPKAHYFDQNLRAIKPEGVDAVMTVFRRRILSRESAADGPAIDLPLDEFAPPGLGQPVPPDPTVLESEFKSVICDEEMIAR